MFKPDINQYLFNNLIKTTDENGDSATVHVAQHVPTGQLVAIKKYCMDDLFDESYQIIQHEIIVTRQLQHPNLISYYTTFVTGPEICVVMPFMSYGSCQDIISANFNDGLPEQVIAYILKDVLSGLDYIHKKGLIHRAVKASHILISGNGQACLSGLRYCCSILENGRWQKCVHSFPSITSKNLKWLSPEVLEQNLQGYNEKSDIYSVGMTACELANGVVPFADMPTTLMLTEKVRGNSPHLLDYSTVPFLEDLASQPEELQGQPSDSGVGESLSQYKLLRERRFSEPFHHLAELCLHKEALHRPSACELTSHSFFKQCKRVGGLISLLKPTFPFLQSEKCSEPPYKD